MRFLEARHSGQFAQDQRRRISLGFKVQFARTFWITAYGLPLQFCKTGFGCSTFSSRSNFVASIGSGNPDCAPSGRAYQLSGASAGNSGRLFHWMANTPVGTGRHHAGPTVPRSAQNCCACVGVEAATIAAPSPSAVIIARMVCSFLRPQWP